ncbi:MAG TPA: nuclear transport factor 2 family protein [Caulobacteraceae bacterium]|jgi:ketosteroid isomerase-like protein|nr:nuclear transport factor 2 family protein [Caulobacteraceae bacterium]
MSDTSPQACVAAFADALIRRDMPAALGWLSDDVVFLYSNGASLVGKAAFEAWMTASWGQVSDYSYASHNPRWIVQSDAFAAVIYGFSWSGVVGGQRVGGSGRGTRVLRHEAAGWRIVHEHLGAGDWTV